MGLWTRLKLIFSAKASSALDRAEDPRQVLDYAYTQQQQLLVKLRQGLVEVATSKQQLDRQSKKLQARVPQLDDQARRAIGAGRDDLARIALERKRTALAEIQILMGQNAGASAEERRLPGQARPLQVRVAGSRPRPDLVRQR